MCSTTIIVLLRVRPGPLTVLVLALPVISAASRASALQITVAYVPLATSPMELQVFAPTAAPLGRCPIMGSAGAKLIALPAQELQATVPLVTPLANTTPSSTQTSVLEAAPTEPTMRASTALIAQLDVRTAPQQRCVLSVHQAITCTMMGVLQTVRLACLLRLAFAQTAPVTAQHVQVLLPIAQVAWLRTH